MYTLLKSVVHRYLKYQISLRKNGRMSKIETGVFTRDAPRTNQQNEHKSRKHGAENEPSRTLCMQTWVRPASRRSDEASSAKQGIPKSQYFLGKEFSMISAMYKDREYFKG